MTSAKRVVGMYNFGMAVLTSAKHVGGLYNFRGTVSTFVKRVRRRLVEDGRFICKKLESRYIDLRKACRRLVEDRRRRFDFS